MTLDRRIHVAPPDSGVAFLGRSLPSLLYDAVASWGDRVTLSQRRHGKWESIGLESFARRAESLAVALRSTGLQRGDRVAFFMESNVDFCLADMACLIAGLVNVPIYLTLEDESIGYVAEHSGAKALFVSTSEHLSRLTPIVAKLHLRAIVVAEELDGGGTSSKTPVFAMTELETRGRGTAPDAAGRLPTVEAMLNEISPSDLATIIYTSGTTGVPKGVMLSHENLSFNAVTSFSGMRGYRRGPDGETGLSFLPLTHVFARALYYGFLESGTVMYFSTPDTIGDDLKEVTPTVFASVPRVIEKVYGRFLERGAVLAQPKKALFKWALELARQFEIGKTMSPGYKVRRAVADRLVFSKWREGLGGRVKYIICGGAALSAELANIFGAADIAILQGYGLTETSPVIAFNRPEINRAGTVGVPIPGVEVRIADDGEIVTRGPHVMLGYYKAPEKTAEVIDDDGWFHTGDIGEFDPDGFLKITDRKKDLFKLSTGKYVMPQPLEHRLAAEALIDQAVVTGASRRYCTALIFPSESALRVLAQTYGLPAGEPIGAYFDEERILARFQELVDKANRGMDHWSTIKRFKLIAEPLTIESGLLTPTMKVKRGLLAERFALEIEQLYAEADHTK